MMYHLSTRTASALLAFGIFFALSCSTLSTSSDSATELFEAGQYSTALSAVNDDIQSNPDDRDLKVLKAQILREMAVEDYEPENREQVYRNLRETVDEVSFSSDRYESETDSLLSSAWRHEQSAGVRLLQQDASETFDQHFDRVIAHFSNAVTIIPDSIVTYNLMATTYYRHGNLSEAISTLESIEEKGLTRPPETCEKLAYLYLEAGQIDQAVDIYEGLAEEYPDTEIYQQGLVNSYILGNMHDEAIDLLLDLTDEYPNRVQYREALATERFYALRQRINEEVESSGFSGYSETEINDVMGQLDEIGGIFQDVDITLPASEERQQRIAAFYVSAADLLDDLREHSQGSSPDDLGEQRETYLRASIPFWQTLYEANQDRSAYAYSLIEVYRELGMNDQAELLEQQVNF